MSDENDFYKAMGEVRRIKTESRVTVKKQSPSHSVFAARRIAAESTIETLSDPLSGSQMLPLEPNAIVAFRRDGIQHGVYKQLRMGRYTIDARLDLHRMVVSQARIAVYQFICDCTQNDLRCALITHGKGEGRKTPAVLKSYLAHWLPQVSEVLAFYSARPYHGGAGATYVLLKKSKK